MVRRRHIRFPYRRISDDLRGDITTGVYSPGQRLPSEADLVAKYGVSRRTAARAFDVVEHEGLVVRGPKPGRFVRQVTERELIEAWPGDRIGARLPFQSELDDLEVDEITPLLVVTRSDGTVDRYPSDRCDLLAMGNIRPIAIPPTADPPGADPEAT